MATTTEVKDFHSILSLIEDIKTNIKDSQYKKIVDMLMKLQKQSEEQDIAVRFLQRRHAHDIKEISRLEKSLSNLSIRHLNLDKSRCENCNGSDCDDEDD